MSHEPPDPFADDLRAQLNGYAQQAAALRRERDEERASRLAILERLTPACEMLLAKGDTDTFNVLTGNGMHVPPVRRDVVEALREARAARDSLADELAAARARVTEYHREVERRDELIRGADADLAASDGAWLEERLAEARREQAETDFAAWVEALADEGETSHPDVARAVAEHDAKVRTGRDNAWLSALETETVCAAPLTPRGMFDAVTSHDDRVHAAALEEAAEAGAFRVTAYDNVGVELEIIADRVRRAIQDIAATPSDAPAPERAKCMACDGEGNAMEDHDGRLGYGACRDCGGTGEVKP